MQTGNEIEFAVIFPDTFQSEQTAVLLSWKQIQMCGIGKGLGYQMDLVPHSVVAVR